MDNMGDGGRALALIVFGPFVFLVLLALWGLVSTPWIWWRSRQLHAGAPGPPVVRDAPSPRMNVRAVLIGAMIAAALYASTAAAFTWITGECGPGRYKDAIGECQPDEH